MARLRVEAGSEAGLSPVSLLAENPAPTPGY